MARTIEGPAGAGSRRYFSVRSDDPHEELVGSHHLSTGGSAGDLSRDRSRSTRGPTRHPFGVAIPMEASSVPPRPWRVFTAPRWTPTDSSRHQTAHGRPGPSTSVDPSKQPLSHLPLPRGLGRPAGEPPSSPIQVAHDSVAGGPLPAQGEGRAIPNAGRQVSRSELPSESTDINSARPSEPGQVQGNPKKSVQALAFVV